MKIQAFYRRIVDDPPYLNDPTSCLAGNTKLFPSGEIGFMAYGAMGIRTPDLLNAIEALYQLSYDPLPKHIQNTKLHAQCHKLSAKEIVLLAILSSPSFLHDEPS